MLMWPASVGDHPTQHPSGHADWQFGCRTLFLFLSEKVIVTLNYCSGLELVFTHVVFSPKAGGSKIGVPLEISSVRVGLRPQILTGTNLSLFSAGTVFPRMTVCAAGSMNR